MLPFVLLTLELFEHLKVMLTPMPLSLGGSLLTASVVQPQKPRSRFERVKNNLGKTAFLLGSLSKGNTRKPWQSVKL